MWSWQVPRVRKDLGSNGNEEVLYITQKLHDGSLTIRWFKCHAWDTPSRLGGGNQLFSRDAVGVFSSLSRLGL